MVNIELTAMVQIKMGLAIICKYLKRIPLIWVVIPLIMVAAFVYIINDSPIFYNFIKSDSSGHAYEEIHSWLLYVSSGAAVTVAVVAWIKVGAIQKQNEERLFLYIDEQWGSAEILKAREIIDSLYREVQIENKELIKLLPDMSKDFQDSIYVKRSKKHVSKLYKKNEDKVGLHSMPLIMTKDIFVQEVLGIIILNILTSFRINKKFIYLLNFLDFMDTIGYLAKDKDNDFIQELDDLCGDSIVFHYKVFEPYIIYKRLKHENENGRKFYNNFEDLNCKLSSKNYKSKEGCNLSSLLN